MSKFLSAAKAELNSIDNTYINSRYAPTGSEQIGKPFLNYKDYGGRMTDYRSSGVTESTWKKEFNLPTNNNFYRTSVTADALNLGNQQNSAWVAQTSTLTNVGNTLACNATVDCEAWPGTTCNRNYENWPDAHGNQSGTFCSQTQYPELQQNGNSVGPSGGGQYNRKLAGEGGIGRGCTVDSDCGDGYSCNNEYDFNGSNLQQTGYCAMKYTCSDGTTHFLGTPYNSGVPLTPPTTQNNGGKGYSTLEQCSGAAMAQQDCVKGANNQFYAVYPGYCAVPKNYRQNNNAYGNVRTSGAQTVNNGFIIPAFATNNASQTGSKLQAFATWNTPSAGEKDGSSEALMYSMATNPIPRNLY